MLEDTSSLAPILTQQNKPKEYEFWDFEIKKTTVSAYNDFYTPGRYKIIGIQI